MTPFYNDGTVTIYHGDALPVLLQLEPASVDALLTDPPYSSGGQFRGDRALDPKTKYVNTDSVNQDALGTFNGDSRSELGHLYWCASWLMEATRIVKPGGIAGLFTDWRQLPATILALQAGGWVWRGVVPWHKPGARPVIGRFTNECEYMVWGTNGPRALDGPPFPGFYLFPPDAPVDELGAEFAPFYSVSTERNRQHITQKPLSLFRALLEVVPVGGVVLDPFMGSGTTLRAAADGGRRAIGVDSDAAYCAIAAGRLAQGTLDFGPTVAPTVAPASLCGECGGALLTEGLDDGERLRCVECGTVHG